MNFTKMHGLGYDFVVIDNTNNNVDLNQDAIKKLAHRHFGIGFDQLLMVEQPTNPNVAEFKYRIFNADGSEVEQCGNGARCFARFVAAKKLTTNNPISVETQAGVISLLIQNEDVVVSMGQANFNPNAIIESNSKQQTYNIAGYEIGLVSMGNPHAVLIVDDIQQDIQEIAQTIQAASEFKNGVNVGFMQIIDTEHIKLRVYERGSGETLACGSGACAAVNVGVVMGLLSHNVVVSLPGGDCTITIQEDTTLLTGPATFVFEGSVNI
jgi:diaminopimelate epimerase